jgi:NAD(P)-dependent dehydrogenase (short-subunit alcohol dehydrogenase family)
MARLAGKVAIVTGAGGGIGGAIGRQFAAEGASVVCVDIDGAAVGNTTAAIAAAGGQAAKLVADVASEETAIEAVALARSRFGLWRR